MNKFMSLSLNALHSLLMLSLLLARNRLIIVIELLEASSPGDASHAYVRVAHEQCARALHKPQLRMTEAIPPAAAPAVAEPEADECSVCVAVHVRPLIDSELQEGCGRFVDDKSSTATGFV